MVYDNGVENGVENKKSYGNDTNYMNFSNDLSDEVFNFIASNIKSYNLSLKTSDESEETLKKVEMAKEQVEPFFKQLFEKYDFCIRFKLEKKDLIKKEGFKSRFELDDYKQVQDENIEDYNDLRSEIENSLFGINSEKYYIKYGYLSDRNTKLSAEKNSNAMIDISTYGNVRATLNKDKLFNKTTFTLGDSFGGMIKSSKVSDPSIFSIPGVVYGNYNLLFEIYNGITNFSLRACSPMKFCSALKEDYVDYFELQFHSAIPYEFVDQIDIMN